MPKGTTAPIGATRLHKPTGYMVVKTAEGLREWPYEHRVVMEQKLGRALARNEHVHHLNGNRTDNRPENLVLMDHAAHSKLPKPLICSTCGYRHPPHE